MCYKEACWAGHDGIELQILMKILGITGISVGVVVLLLVGVDHYLVSGMCANTVIASSASPGGKWKVVLFERNCGATTGFSSHISLLESDDQLANETGNIYVADGYPEGYSLSWESDVSVKIGGTSGRRYRGITELSGVRVIYE